MNKKELIERVAKMPEEDRKLLPRHKPVVRAKIRHLMPATVKLAEPFSRPSYIWDIVRTSSGWTYFETDRRCRISCVMFGGDLSLLADRVMKRFLERLGLNVKETPRDKNAEQEWTISSMEDGKENYVLPFDGIHDIELSYDRKKQAAVAKLIRYDADGRRRTRYAIEKTEFAHTSDARKWAKKAYIGLFRDTAAECRRLETVLSHAGEWHDEKEEKTK